MKFFKLPTTKKRTKVKAKLILKKINELLAPFNLSPLNANIEDLLNTCSKQPTTQKHVINDIIRSFVDIPEAKGNDSSRASIEDDSKIG